MKTQGEHIRTLQRRIDFLKAREYKNSYDQAELGALEWALVNLPPAHQGPVAWLQIGLPPLHGGDVIARTTKPTKWNPEWWRFEPLYTSPPAQRNPPQFPTMLRKMWSGAEVQKWINENWEQT